MIGRMATRALHVFGWQGWRNDCPIAANGNKQTREIVAATSMAAAARAAGVRGPRSLWNLSVTGNPTETAIALAAPGVVFWSPDDSKNDAGAFRRAGKP